MRHLLVGLLIGTPTLSAATPRGAAETAEADDSSEQESSILRLRSQGELVGAIERRDLVAFRERPRVAITRDADLVGHLLRGELL